MIRTATLIRCLTAGIVLQCASAQAANIVVNSTADSGSACTLRNAIQNAVNNNQTNSACAAGSGADTITFDPTVFATPQTITVGSTLPQLTDTSTTTIDGGNKVTIDGGGKVQIFWVGNLGNGTGSAVLRNLIIANGNADGTGTNGYYGGGVFMTGTSLELDHITFSGSTAKFGGGGIFTQGSGITTADNCIFTGNSIPTGPGGGIYDSSATVNVANSTFVGNSADSGAGIIAGGGTVMVTNSTFNGNSGNRGNAIRNLGATMTVDYVTISGNSATSFGEGALSQEGGALTLSNSIVAGNTNGDCYNSSFTNAGHNFFGDSSCGAAGSGSPMLASLNYTGGLTPTMVPQTGSPVLGAAACEATVTTDQRGVARPQKGKCDIGAVEVEASIFTNGFE